MSDAAEARLEALAEAVAFAHDPSTAMPADADPAALQSLERTAAFAAAAFAGNPVVPPALQARLAAAGLAFCAEPRRRRGPPPALRAVPTSPTAAPASARRSPLGTLATFLVGAAAGIGLWLAVGNRTPTVPTAEPAGLLAQDPGAVKLPWKPGPSPKSGTVVGEVVWSQERQQGYLSFRGLPPCDADHRFQLWIVDGTRDGAPVDGGLFGIADGSTETVVPVHARLPIGKPAAFVVTLETKAGVVVSKQEHVVAIAGL